MVSAPIQSRPPEPRQLSAIRWHVARHQRGTVPAMAWNTQLVDGCFAAHGQIDAVADKTEIYAHLPQARAVKGKGHDDDPEPPAPGSQIQPKAEDSEAAAQWHQRMGTDAT